MLDVAREYAAAEGVELDLRLGDLREPPVQERVPLVLIPFRSLLHMTTEDERLRALRAARELLLPGGRLVFDVFAPSAEDVEDTHGRWLEREPGIFERADWDENERTLTLSVRRGEEASTMLLAWLSPPNGVCSSTAPASTLRRSGAGSTAGRTPAARTSSLPRSAG